VTQIFNKIKKTSIQLPRILEKIREYIAVWDIYFRTKYRRYKPYGLIKLPDIPDRPWESVAWDFIIKLLESKKLINNV
jgi:hypothetical protein